MARSCSMLVLALFVGAGCHGSIEVSQSDAPFDPCDAAACLSCGADVDCDDGDPCNGTERCHPDRGGCYKSDNRPQEGAECCFTGLCVPACAEDSDCGAATYCGGNPVCVDGVCVRVPMEEGSNCPLDEQGGQGVCLSGECMPAQRLCTATYELSGHELVEYSIEYLPFVIHGEMVLHYEANREDDGPLDGGDVAIRFLWLRKENVFSSGGVTVTSAVNVYTPRCNGEEVTTEWNPPPAACADDGNVSAMAVGTWGSNVVTWATCDAHPDWASIQGGAYTPDDESVGPGCLGAVHERGNVHCAAGGFLVTCPSWAPPGDNELNEVYNQPLKPLELTEDGSRLFLPWTYTPNRQPERTRVSFSGTRTSVTCTP